MVHVTIKLAPLTLSGPLIDTDPVMLIVPAVIETVGADMVMPAGDSVIDVAGATNRVTIPGALAMVTGSADTPMPAPGTSIVTKGLPGMVRVAVCAMMPA